MCGVLILQQISLTSSKGSSPHVRGFADEGILELMKSRFIPSCAGFCGVSGAQGGMAKVHPRMCGVLALCSSRTGA